MDADTVGSAVVGTTASSLVVYGYSNAQQIVPHMSSLNKLWTQTPLAVLWLVPLLGQWLYLRVPHVSNLNRLWTQTPLVVLRLVPLLPQCLYMVSLMISRECHIRVE
ncbi:hypothetical protein J6590_023924 [Homalodisca vitripennis]|nr:hypothetical protein J6590_023924 [Homalodisca vitripennis]